MKYRKSETVEAVQFTGEDSIPAIMDLLRDPDRQSQAIGVEGDGSLLVPTCRGKAPCKIGDYVMEYQGWVYVQIKDDFEKTWAP